MQRYEKADFGTIFGMENKCFWLWKNYVKSLNFYIIVVCKNEICLHLQCETPDTQY